MSGTAAAISELKRLQRNFAEYQTQTAKALQEVRENNRRTVEEHTTRITQCKLIIRHLMEYKDSSEQKIRELEQANALAMQHSSDQANGTLQWMADIEKRVDNLKWDVGELQARDGSFERWRKQWSSDEGIEPTAGFSCATDGH